MRFCDKNTRWLLLEDILPCNKPLPSCRQLEPATGLLSSPSLAFPNSKLLQQNHEHTKENKKLQSKTYEGSIIYKSQSSQCNKGNLEDVVPVI